MVASFGDELLREQLHVSEAGYPAYPDEDAQWYLKRTAHWVEHLLRNEPVTDSEFAEVDVVIGGLGEFKDEL